VDGYRIDSLYNAFCVDGDVARIWKANPSSTTYKTSTIEFAELTEAFIKKNMIGVDNGIPVVRPEPNSDVFVMGEMWRWSPVLVLEVNQFYKLHISSKDVVHGLSIQPVNMNFQVYPSYDYLLELSQPNPESTKFSAMSSVV
jgi:cytochrome c oxidase subunit 2